MSIRSGVGAQVGIAKETTVGTVVAPVTFLPFTTEGFKRANTYVRTNSIRAGRLAQSSAQHTLTTHDASGPLNLNVLTKDMGKLLNLMHGNAVTPIQIAATTAYTQTHVVGTTDPFGKSLSVQVGRPDVGGVVDVFTYLGSKLTKVTFNLAKGGVVTSTWEFDCMDENVAQTLGTATYTTSNAEFGFQVGSIELDDVVLTECVQSIQIEYDFPQAVDRYCINNSTIKKEPILNGPISVVATAELEFASMTQHTAFTSSTRHKLELNCSTGDAGGGNPFAFNQTVPATVVTDAGPVVDGPDILTQSVVMEGVDDGTNPLATLVYVSTATTI